jgi:hypothetical protein
MPTYGAQEDMFTSGHSKFQYKTLGDNALPFGGGTAESPIRRIINLRI